MEGGKLTETLPAQAFSLSSTGRCSEILEASSLKSKISKTLYQKWTFNKGQDKKIAALLHRAWNAKPESGQGGKYLDDQTLSLY